MIQFNQNQSIVYDQNKKIGNTQEFRSLVIRHSNTNSIFNYPDSDAFEFYIVSLDNKQWHFEAATSDERDEWVSVIEQAIFKSLQANESANVKQLSSSEVASMQSIRSRVAGNGFCADCDAPSECAETAVICVCCHFVRYFNDVLTIPYRSRMVQPEFGHPDVHRMLRHSSESRIAHQQGALPGTGRLAVSSTRACVCDCNSSMSNTSFRQCTQSRPHCRYAGNRQHVGQRLLGVGRPAGHHAGEQTDAGVVARGQGALDPAQVRVEGVCAVGQRCDRRRIAAAARRGGCQVSGQQDSFCMMVNSKLICAFVCI